MLEVERRRVQYLQYTHDGVIQMIRIKSPQAVLQDKMSIRCPVSDQRDIRKLQIRSWNTDSHFHCLVDQPCDR